MSVASSIAYARPMAMAVWPIPKAMHYSSEDTESKITQSVRLSQVYDIVITSSTSHHQMCSYDLLLLSVAIKVEVFRERLI